MRFVGVSLLAAGTVAAGEVSNVTFLAMSGNYVQMLPHLYVALVGFILLWVFNHPFAATFGSIAIAFVSAMGHSIVGASLGAMAGLALLRDGDKSLGKAQEVLEMANNLNLFAGWGVSNMSYTIIAISLLLVLRFEIFLGEPNQD